MNPNAREFVFKSSAPEFIPGGFRQAPAAAAPPPVAREPVPEPIPEPVPEPEIESAEVNGEISESQENEEETIDENDPLWMATLELTGGDREKAMQLLEDPDELMKYPNIKAIMEGTAPADEWDQVAAKVEDIKLDTPSDTPAAIVSPKAESVTPKVQTSSSSSAAVIDGDEAVDDEVMVEETDPRQHLNLVFIGHVDAGKSTLSGSILYIMGMVDARTIERYEREAKQRNRESWFLAFIMDTSEEERAKGKTVEVGRAHFETAINRYTILDAPGHKNYVPNMISGAAQADVAILVISARKGEFETGFEKGGQTREHALLAKTLGVQYLVVVINKMDDPTVKWDQKRYEECVGKLKPYLKQCGYVIKRDIKFVPISALSGDNVLNEVKSEKCAWWKELYTTGAHNTTTPTLLSTLDSLQISGRNPDGPLRVPCLDRYAERGTVVLGKVESGTLRVDDEVVIAPTKKRAKVEGIYVGDVKVRTAKPGENVLVKFSALNLDDIQKGYVMSLPENICPSVVSIKAHLALVGLLEHRPIFSKGYEAVLHVHTVEIEVECTQVYCVIENGEEKIRPFGRTGQQIVVKLTFPLSTCMEPFAQMPALGRLTLRDEGTTIAIGKVVALL